jgi:Protein of unknown function (DUF1493)
MRGKFYRYGLGIVAAALVLCCAIQIMRLPFADPGGNSFDSVLAKYIWRFLMYVVLPGGLVMLCIQVRARMREDLSRERRRKWLCHKCGYDLRGNSSSVCPECATTVKERTWVVRRTSGRPDSLLRQRILELVSEYAGVPVTRLTDADDLGRLGLTGDDADELMNEFFLRFAVHGGGYDFLKYFDREGVFPLPGTRRTRHENLTITDLLAAAERGSWE